MSSRRRKHPVITTIAIVAIAGGLFTMVRSLMMLHAALEQQYWPTAELHRDNPQQVTYRVGEQHFSLSNEQQSQLKADTALVFYNPESPQQTRVARPNFWWPLYLSMAGLIVLYAGLHLLRENDRSVHDLSFE